MIGVVALEQGSERVYVNLLPAVWKTKLDRAGPQCQGQCSARELQIWTQPTE